MEKKAKIVHYINQFFGQIGGEDKANTGFILKEGPIGPGIFLDNLFGEQAEIVATIICGDNYFNQNVEQAVEEGIKLVANQLPNLFIAGPAFNAGRYGVACGAMANAVQEILHIPSITAMYPENPAAQIYKNLYIIKTGMSAGQMKEVLTRVLNLGQKIIKGETIGNASKEGYIPRGRLQNEFVDKNGAVRGIDLLMAKVNNKSFETELVIPNFEDIPPALPLADLKQAKIALVSDGGLVPKGNPDRIKSSQNTIYKAYNIDDFLAGPFAISHSGYHPTEIRQNVNRLIPVDILREMESEGMFASLLPVFFSTSGNTTTVQSAQNIGKGIATDLKEAGVDGVILTST